MGWVLDERDWAYSDRAEVWLDQTGAVVMTRHAWRPHEDDAQAMQVLDRLAARGCEVTMEVAADGAKVTVRRDGSDAFSASGRDRRQALLRAAAGPDGGGGTRG